MLILLEWRNTKDTIWRNACILGKREATQNLEKWWKASKMDNVRHAERDYLVKAWIGWQLIGPYPLVAKLPTGMRVETVASNWRFKKNISNHLHAGHPFYCLFDAMHLPIGKHNFTAPHIESSTEWAAFSLEYFQIGFTSALRVQTLQFSALHNNRWAVYKGTNLLFPK